MRPDLDPLDPYDLVPTDWTPRELDQLRQAVRDRETRARDRARAQMVQHEADMARRQR